MNMITQTEAIKLLRNQDCSENLIEHCKTVSHFATQTAMDLQKSGKTIDVELVSVGALLHDLGRCKSHGIDHAIIGAKIAFDAGVDSKIVNIIKKHIGAGITKDEAIKLGLPEDDYIPYTIEEKIVANADNFISGSKKINMAQLMAKMKKRNYTQKNIDRIISLANEIGVY